MTPSSLRVLGIDPGSRSAAYALLVDGVARVGDVPTADNMVEAATWFRLVRELKPDLAVIEGVHAMPKQGATSGFKFGLGTGLLRGVVLGLGIRLITVRPADWKKHYSLGSDKEKARERAISLFPVCSDLSRKMDHGRAEALLLANFYLEKLAKSDNELV